MDQDNPETAIKRGPGRPKKMDSGIISEAAALKHLKRMNEIMAPDATPADEAPAPRRMQYPMKRNPEQYPPPHTASVHVDEVDNWKKHGWEHAD